MPQAAVVSVVDDDESLRNALDSLLRSNGYTVRTYADAETFLASSGPHDTRCLISDIQMPGMSGTQLHDELSARGMNIPVIFITGFQGTPPPLNLHSPEPIAYFPKPFSCAELIACLEDVFNHLN